MSTRYEYTKNIEGKYMNSKAKIDNRVVHYTNKQIAMAENMRKDGLMSNRDINNTTGVDSFEMLTKKTTKCFKHYTAPYPYRKIWKNYNYDRNNKAKDIHYVLDLVGWKSGHIDYWCYYYEEGHDYS